ncbi:hypothetical protein FNV43_RR18859 [Rhamnella rubrinervis]|uniref:NET domain-containing protein n=1 Tax=Rhamnella rubrinervis TaxID=2594499 RepID=A0A8K0GY52_9ROSA|nr:hypothetical protein FNV43_RR18859 [Rhamnella rubrinervis]
MGHSSGVDDDLKFLLENDDSIRVEETVKNYSDELSATLRYMELQLEELLDLVMSKPMTLAEKRKLWKVIQVLTPKHLDHVVKIIQRSNPAETKYILWICHVPQNIFCGALDDLFCEIATVGYSLFDVAVEEGPSKATTDDNLHDGAMANEEEEGCEQERPSSFTDFTEPPEDGDVEGDGMENATDLEYMESTRRVHKKRTKTTGQELTKWKKIEIKLAVDIPEDIMRLVGVNSQTLITEKSCVVLGFAPVIVAGWKDIKKEKGDDLLCEMRF